jgi:hypothetical protein
VLQTTATVRSFGERHQKVLPLSHANWTYRDDYTGLIFWARKGSDPSEELTRFEVNQNDLNFWQALSRCVAYVAYTIITEKDSEPGGAANPLPPSAPGDC